MLADTVSVLLTDLVGRTLGTEDSATGPAVMSPPDQTEGGPAAHT